MEDPRAIGWEIEKTTKERFAAVAARTPLSNAELLELLMLRMLDTELTDEGIPSWLPEADTEELPIDSP
ncbi:hypothetical protein [Clavibacter michiganensis]|nr:hypothetical protein [Clavibacter michiganensis]